MDARLREPRLAKLTMPSAAGTVLRDRLFQRIGDSQAAVWVGAPAGAGKTTLLASYVERNASPVLWYQVDRGDADLASFFYFLGLAARRVAPDADALPLLAPEYLSDLPAFVRRFFRALFSELPPHCVVVFDNYQEVEDVPVFQSMMRVILEEVLPGIQVVLLSRNALPASLARFHANRKMQVIGWEELRLTPAESHSLLGAAFDTASVERLHTLSQGWAAGLLLLRDLGETALPMQQEKPDRAPGILFNYFASEIYSSAAPEVRQLLRRTAFFPSFTAEMAVQVSGVSDAGELLDRLTREHFFVGCRSEPQVSYQYHALFQDFLRTLVRQPAEATKARRDCADILAANGRAEDAVDLYLDAGEAGAATALILECAPRLIGQGRWQTLKRWIDALPAGHAEQFPWLILWRGVAELAAAPSQARTTLEGTYERFAVADDVVGQLFAASGVIDACFLEWSEFHALDRWIDVLEGLWDKIPLLPSPEHRMRVVTSMLAAITHRRPLHRLAASCVEKLLDLLDRVANGNAKSLSAMFLLQYLLWFGDFRLARRVRDMAARLEDSTSPLNAILLAHSVGTFDIMAGNETAALGQFDKADRIAIENGLALAAAVHIAPLRAYAALSFGKLDQAPALIERSAPASFSAQFMNATQYCQLNFWLAAQRGEWEQARANSKLASDYAERTGSMVSRPWTLSCHALALAACGDLAGARAGMLRVRDLLPDQTAGLLHFQVLLCEAFIALTDAGASQALREAMALGARQGYANTLAWHPGLMSRLCSEALRLEIEPPFVLQLIHQRGLQAVDPAAEHWPWPIRIRTLGVFSVIRDEVPLTFTGKTPKKPIALLKAIVALGGREVAESRLADMLWPGAEADAAIEALSVNLHRLRKILGNPAAILMREGRISLSRDICWVDAWAFELMVGQPRERPEAGYVDADLVRANEAITLYRGNFLAAEHEEPWMIPVRERLRAKFVQHLTAVARSYYASQRPEQALALYLHGIEIDDLVESFYQGLMSCYLQLGRRADGLATYRRLHSVLSRAHGLIPAPESEALLTALRNI